MPCVTLSVMKGGSLGACGLFEIEILKIGLSNVSWKLACDVMI